MNPENNSITRVLITITLITISLLLIFFVYKRYELNPRTRHGIVRADIIEVAPQISGEVADVFVKDNQVVKKGDLLFSINSRPFLLAKEKAENQLLMARQKINVLKACVKIAEARYESSKIIFEHEKKDKIRNEILFKAETISQKFLDDSVKAYRQAEMKLEESDAALNEAKARLGLNNESNLLIKSAILDIKNAELNLSYTKVYSPADGYVVNVVISKGDYLCLGTPAIAVVDKKSLHVTAAFKETQLKFIKEGDTAIVSLMTSPDIRIKGKVASIGRAINPDGYKGADAIVPGIPAVFDWVRLAQRIPVEVFFQSPPEDLNIIPGVTASVIINSK